MTDRDGSITRGEVCEMRDGRSNDVLRQNVIAAAPELLEALKAMSKLGIFKGVEETRGVGVYAHRNGLWDKAQAAIAKAEGRS